MEIVFLNTLNGKVRQPIKEFISSCRDKTDIFCLQEVYEGENNMRQLANELLPDYMSAHAHKAIEKDDFPQSTYTHSRVSVLRNEILFPTEQDYGLGIVTEIELEGSQLTICNFHGRSRPGNKLDTPERLTQSQGVIDYFQNVEGPKIIGGDFNLDLNTESIHMFERAGYKNLIAEMGIHTTRDRIAWEMYPETPQLYSDFVFVSQGLLVTNFEVPQIEISDHLPMILSVASLSGDDD